jgi:hypothetical protein
MKIIVKIFIILAVFFASCDKDKPTGNDNGNQPPETPAGTITTITAAAPDASQTKVSLTGDDKNELRWAVGDKIYVAEINEGKFIASFGLSAFEAKTVDTGGKTATFTLVAGQKALTAGRQYVAVHAGEIDANINAAGEIEHYFPEAGTQLGAGVFTNSDKAIYFTSNVATAAVAEVNFSFKHLMSLLEFDIWTDDPASFAGFNIDRVTIEAIGMPFVTALTCNAASMLNVSASTDKLYSLLRVSSGVYYPLNATHLKLRIPLMWNPDASPAGDFIVTLQPQAGSPVVFTKPAVKLEPGAIYRMSLKATVEKAVMLSATQSQPLYVGMPDMTFYSLATSFINSGTGSVTWFSDAQGTTPAAAPPAGVTVSSPINWDTNIIYVTTSDATPTGTYYFRVAFTASGVAVWSDVASLIVSSDNKTLTVGPQQADIGITLAGAVSYPWFNITSAFIADGATGSVAWYADASGSGSPITAPANVTTVFNYPLTNGRATLNITLSASIAAGTHYFRVSFGGVTSNVGTLTILPAGTPNVRVSAKEGGALYEGVANNANYFNVFTLNIAETPQPSSIAWFSDVDGTVSASKPAGVEMAVSHIGSYLHRIDLTCSNETKWGTYYFRLTLGGATSGVATLSILPSNKAVNIGEPFITNIYAGLAGYTGYYLTAPAIATGVSGTVSWFASADGSGTGSPTPPAGITATVSPVTSSYSSYVRFDGTTATKAGSYYFKVTIDGVTSSVATLTIQPLKTVTIGGQSKDIIAGAAGSASFVITTENIAMVFGSVMPSYKWYSDKEGLNEITRPAGLGGTVTFNSSSMVVYSITTTADVPAGNYYFRATVDGTRSAVATLAVTAPVRTVTLGATQTHPLYAGNNGSTYYSIKTENFDDDFVVGSVQWYSNAAGTTSASAPADVTVSIFYAGSPYMTVGAKTAAQAGTYYFRISFDGIQSAQVAKLVITPVPTDISITTGTLYRHVGETVEIPFTVTPSNADLSTLKFAISTDYPYSTRSTISVDVARKVLIYTNGANFSGGGSMNMDAFKTTETITVSSPAMSSRKLTDFYVSGFLIAWDANKPSITSIDDYRFIHDNSNIFYDLIFSQGVPLQWQWKFVYAANAFDWGNPSSFWNNPWTGVIDPLKYNFTRVSIQGTDGGLTMERISGTNVWKWTNNRTLGKHKVTMKIGNSTWIKNYATL